MMTDHDPIENRDAIYPGLPRNIKEALEGPDADKWYHAYDKMIRAFEANKTWRPMRKKDVPHGTPSFDLGTTLSKKRGTGLEKIRVHVNGQRINNERARRDGDAPAEASTEHYRSSSPVASYESLCCQVAYAAATGQVLLQDDINDFYLLTRNEEPYTARFPPGFRKYLERRYPDGIPFDIDDSVLYIEGNLWGHPDAGRIAYEEISPFLRSLGFSPSPSDDCFFIRARPYPLTSATLTLIVDDITVSSDSDDADDIMRDISNR